MKAKITISGMHCASCAANVERSLGKIKGVREAKVSLMINKGFIESDKAIDDDEIKKAVARAGYKALAIEKEN